MNKFSIQIERINKIQSPLPIVAVRDQQTHKFG